MKDIKSDVFAEISDFPNTKLFSRLCDMGLRRGGKIKLLRLCPFKETAEIYFNGTVVAIRMSDAEKIEVKK